MAICEGRVVIVTGAGRGLGRAHALELARQGAKVVVNDLSVSLVGESEAESPADEVVAAIREMGGEAVANGADVADWDQAEQLVAQAVETFGRLDAVVNNAGFLRDRMFVSLSEADWDAVIRVHLKGHFCVTRHACAYWRTESKAGRQPQARIVNTSSGAGLLGSVGQSNYVAAKGGIASLTMVQAAELGRYGVASNAIAPIARTRMTEQVFADMMKDTGGFDEMAPENVSPLVAWLCSADCDVSGRVFEAAGGWVNVNDGWRPAGKIEVGHRWDAAELGDAIRGLLAETIDPMPVYGAK